MSHSDDKQEELLGGECSGSLPPESSKNIYDALSKVPRKRKRHAEKREVA